MSDSKMDVGVLGATGMAGRPDCIARLAGHGCVSTCDGSRRASGRWADRYAEAAPWRLASPMPDVCRDARVEACEPGARADGPLGTGGRSVPRPTR